MAINPIQQWHQVVESRDAKALDGLLAHDCIFESPVVHTPTSYTN